HGAQRGGHQPHEPLVGGPARRAQPHPMLHRHRLRLGVLPQALDSTPCRRPSPDSPMPPIGTSTEAYIAAYPSLTFTAPAGIRAAIRRPRATPQVHTDAFRPSGLALASSAGNASATASANG